MKRTLNTDRLRGAARRHPRVTTGIGAGLGMLAAAAIGAVVFRRLPAPMRAAAIGYVARGPLKRLAA